MEPLVSMMSAMLYERYGFHARAHSLYTAALSAMKRGGGDTTTVEKVLDGFLRRIAVK